MGRHVSRRRRQPVPCASHPAHQTVQAARGLTPFTERWAGRNAPKNRRCLCVATARVSANMDVAGIVFEGCLCSRTGMSLLRGQKMPVWQGLFQLFCPWHLGIPGPQPTACGAPARGEARGGLRTGPSPGAVGSAPSALCPEGPQQPGCLPQTPGKSVRRLKQSAVSAGQDAF